MTRQEAGALLRRHQDALNRHDVDRLAALYADDARLVSPMFDTLLGRVAIADSYRRLFAVFPDYQVQMNDASFIVEGDRVAEFSTATATHTVELFGLPPTGHQIEYHAARLFTFREGLIVDEQRIYDFGGVLERLEKARVDRELTLAAALQGTLLSRRGHDGPHFEVVGTSLACRAIGGDFLEYVDLPSGAVGLALGDVTGKGPAAALLGAMLQGMFAIIASDGTPPSAALARVNRLLSGRGSDRPFATLVYGVLSREGLFTYSNAGHYPFLLVGSATMLQLTAGGPLLGAFEDAVFPEASVPLEPGDLLIAFSDGVIDAVSPAGDEFGVDRFVAAAAACRGLTAAAALQQLFDVFRRFSGGAPQADDATIMVARFRHDKGTDAAGARDLRITKNVR